MMLNHVVRPVFEKFGFSVVRADEIAKPGLISQQVFQFLAKAKICVADLSFHNPNAFYELGVRHAFLLPTIQIIHKARKIPFDLSQGRTITIDTSDSYMVTDHLESAKKMLEEYVRSLLDGNTSREDNPVAVYLPDLKVSLPK
jgi:predicted ATPase